MITLAHLSDVHLAPLPRVAPTDLLNKRITGYVNWQLRRRAALGGTGLATLVEHLHEQAADFTAVTGDLVNIGLDAEIVNALAWLETVGPPERVCVSPGNHDAYLAGTLTRAYTAWRPYLSGETLDGHAFPFVRRIGEIAIISCCSAAATPLFFSAGRFNADQAGRLTRILALLRGHYFRVVLIHHPPDLPAAGRSRTGLWGGERFRAAIEAEGAELILHGHTHHSTVHGLPGPRGDVPVVGVAAAGAAQGGRAHDEPARYNLFRIERTATDWQCTMGEFGFEQHNGEITLRTQMRIY